MPQSESRSVLVVDDDPGIVSLLSDIVRMCGHRAHGVESAEAALDLLPAIAKETCLVISDVTMEGMDGKQFAIEVRELYPTMPDLLISGYSEGNLELHPFT